MHLSSSPVSALGVVLDGVVRSQADPLRQGAVLLLGLGHLLLGLEGFLGLFRVSYALAMVLERFLAVDWDIPASLRYMGFHWTAFEIFFTKSQEVTSSRDIIT